MSHSATGGGRQHRIAVSARNAAMKDVQLASVLGDFNLPMVELILFLVVTATLNPLNAGLNRSRYSVSGSPSSQVRAENPNVPAQPVPHLGHG